MRVAVLSDIHDNIWNLEKVLDKLKDKTDSLIYCGDFCSPFIPPYLARLKLPIYACLGNNDEDHIGLLKQGGEIFNWTFLAQEFGEVELDKRKIAFCHYPKFAELLAKEGGYNAVFHGHNHIASNQLISKTLLVNPGAVCGIQNGKPGKATFAMYDTKTNLAEIIEI